MLAIYKKELKQYFHSMIGFVFLAFFLAIVGIYTWANNFYGGIGNFEVTLGASNFLFVILIPILTMRIVAEENHQGTSQLLYTSPISITKVILGKYFAVMTLFTIGILVIALYPLILNHYGTDVRLAMSYSALIGYYLLGAAYIAIGTFISSRTESQPIAAVVSFIVMLLSYLMTSVAGALPSDATSQAVILSVLWLVIAFLSYTMMKNVVVTIVIAVVGEVAVWIVYAVKASLYEGLVTKILNCAAVASRFNDFTLGIIDYSAIVYYLSIAFLFVFLTIQMIKKSFSSHRLKTGAYSSFVTVLLVALIVVVNLVFGKLELTTDLSSGGLFTLSKETKELAKDIEDEVTIYYMVQDGSEFDYIEKVIKQYDKLGKNIKVVSKDPVANPGFAAQYVEDEISDNDVIVVNENTGAAKYVSNGEMYYQTTDYYSQKNLEYLDVEGRVTAAVQYVLAKDNTKLYTVSGHGEMELSEALSTSFEKMNIEVEDLPLMTTEKIPEDCDILVMNGPTTDLRESERDTVLEYLKAGGDAIILAQYAQDLKMPYFNEVLDYYGLGIQTGVVLEGANHYVSYTNYIIPGVSAATDMFAEVNANNYILMANAQVIQKAKESELRSTVSHTDLLTTSEDSILKKNPTSGVSEKEKGDLEGPFTVGVYAQEELEEEETKLVLYSTATADEILIEDAVGSMVEIVENSIDAKNLSYSTIYMGITTQIFLAVLVIILIPAGLLVAGFGIWFVRRRK